MTKNEEKMSNSISPAQEDYLEAILVIGNDKRIVRVKDLAEVMNVKAPSVNEALSNLKKRGLILQEKYSHVELTKEGEKLAELVYKKHETLKNFFHDVLGVDEKTAEDDACKIEHYLSKTTIKRMVEFAKRKGK
jgi:DtxR family transcriptional regulator, Mn-dependent transcriptional regulator